MSDGRTVIGIEEIAALVCAAQQGDADAFARLAAHYRPALHAVAVARTGSREEAEDLAQDILIQAWRHIGGLDSPQAFPAWLHSIARNACRMWVRRAFRHVSAIEGGPAPPVDPAPPPLELALRRERERTWRRALSNVTEANRTALLMHVWGGYSYAEIAAFLAVPITTVEGRIYRAKLQLRRLLSDEFQSLVGEPRRQPLEEKK